MQEAVLALVALYQKVREANRARCRCRCGSSCHAGCALALQGERSRGAPLTAAACYPPPSLQFTFSLLPGQQPLKVRTTLTMGPAHGVQVTLHRRS